MKRHSSCSQSSLSFIEGVRVTGTGDFHLHTVHPRGKKGLNLQCKLLG